MSKKHVETRFGRIAYLEAGGDDAFPVLFVHGIPTSGWLWRHVLRLLEDDVHGYAPDLLGLGDTETDPAGRFDMDAQAEMLVAFMEAHGHREFGLVCHDQGGAAAQIIAARWPERVAAFVLTDCVCYGNWPVPDVARIQKLARIPGLAMAMARAGLVELIETRTPLSTFRKGVYQRDKLTAEAIGEYLRPLRESDDHRRRFHRFLLAGHPRYSELAVPGLRKFDKPTLILWAADDHWLSPSWGRRLFEDIPGSVGFELIPFCGHFWQEERPAEFVAPMRRFFAQHLGAARVAGTA